MISCLYCKRDLPPSDLKTGTRMCFDCIAAMRPTVSEDTSAGRVYYSRAERRRQHNIRAKIVTLLGSQCKRCHIADPRVLQVDHVNGGGNAERKALGSNTAVYNRALQHPEDYQLLCANCNWIKRHENNETAPRINITT